jgi:hypothetical protein
MSQQHAGRKALAKAIFKALARPAIYGPTSAEGTTCHKRIMKLS